MKYFSAICCLLARVMLVTASSFYDNPEQDPVSAAESEREELIKKWDFEVFGHLLSTLFLF